MVLYEKYRAKIIIIIIAINFILKLIHIVLSIIHLFTIHYLVCYTISGTIWRPSSLSELNPNSISLGLTHLGSEASI